MEKKWAHLKNWEYCECVEVEETKVVMIPGGKMGQGEVPETGGSKHAGSLVQRSLVCGSLAGGSLVPGSVVEENVEVELGVRVGTGDDHQQRQAAVNAVKDAWGLGERKLISKFGESLKNDEREWREVDEISLTRLISDR